jgi:hypothetical protein
MMARSGELERVLQAMLMRGAGEPGGERGKDGAGRDGAGNDGSADGPGGADATKMQALREAILARLAAMGGEPDGQPGEGSGPHLPDLQRARREAMNPSGALHAPSQMGEGERAIQAIQGLGRGGKAKASYEDVFPSYGAAAEEGIADEHVPAARRAAVRRYFQAIRPEQR